MKPRITTAQMTYAARRVHATIDDPERGKVETARDRILDVLAETTLSAAVRGKLEEARDQLNEVLGAAGARETAAQLAGAWPILARRPLQLERGRTPAPRPRSIHDVIRERRLTR